MLNGTGRFVDPHTVAVDDGGPAAAGDRRIDRDRDRHPAGPAGERASSTTAR